MTIADSESVSLDVHLPGKRSCFPELQWGTWLPRLLLLCSSSPVSLCLSLAALCCPSLVFLRSRKKECLINENRLIGCVPISPVIYSRSGRSYFARSRASARILRVSTKPPCPRPPSRDSISSTLNYNCAA